MEKVLKVGTRSIEFVLLGMAVAGIVIAIVNLMIGNVHSSACFEI